MQYEKMGKGWCSDSASNDKRTKINYNTCVKNINSLNSQAYAWVLNG